MMDDIDAAVGGCSAGGATEIILRDGHHGGHNIIFERLSPAVTCVCGAEQGKPVTMGLDESVSGVILLGYHAMAGTDDGVLRHTQSSASGRRYFYNARENGELGQHALIAGSYNVPVIMLSGDEATCREARAFLGDDIPTVSTKIGFGEQYARLFPPARVHADLHETAKCAVENAANFKPYKIAEPIAGRLQFPDKSFADTYRRKSEKTRRVDDVAYERVFDHANEVLEF